MTERPKKLLGGSSQRFIYTHSADPFYAVFLSFETKRSGLKGDAEMSFCAIAAKTGISAGQLRKIHNKVAKT